MPTSKSSRAGRSTRLVYLVPAVLALAAALLASCSGKAGGSHLSSSSTSFISGSTTMAGMPTTTSSTSTSASSASSSTSTTAPATTTTAPTGAHPASFACAGGSQGGFASGTTVTSGPDAVTVVYSSTVSDLGSVVSSSITVTDHGAIVLEDRVAPVRVTGFRGDQQWNSFRQLCIQVPKAGLPLVYLNGMFASGAACCFAQRVYFPSPTGILSSIDINTETQPVDVKDLYGDVVAVTGDDSFMGVFDCIACSATPVLIYQFEKSQFVAVTRGFPIQIKDDAAGIWKQIQQNLTAVTSGSSQGDVAGLYPAWVADECEIGNQTQAYSTLSSAASSGQFGGYSGGGSTYVHDVESFVVNQGYCS